MRPRPTANEVLDDWMRPAREWNERHPPGTRVTFQGKVTKTYGKAFLNTFREVRVRLEGTLEMPMVTELEFLDQLTLPLSPTGPSGAKTQDT